MSKVRTRIDDDYRRAVEEVLAEFGVTEFCYLGMGKRFKRHPALVFTVAGREVCYPLPGSPSCSRGHLATKTDLRRLCRFHTAQETR